MHDQQVSLLKGICLIQKQLLWAEVYLGRARGEPCWPAPEATLLLPSCSSESSSAAPAAAAAVPAPMLRPPAPRHIISPLSAADPVSKRAAARVVLHGFK